MDFRDIKKKGRAAIAERFKVRSFAFTAKSGLAKTVWPRVHTQWGALGSVMGTNLVYGTRQDEKPKLIFLRSEWEPKRGDVVVCSAEEGYIVEATDPPYNLTTTALVRPMKKSELEEYPSPEGGELAYVAMTGLLPRVSASIGPTVTVSATGFLPVVDGELQQ